MGSKSTRQTKERLQTTNSSTTNDEQHTANSSIESREKGLLQTEYRDKKVSDY